ncbi:molybdenum cofactor biosynthesis protein MoaE [Brevibacterium sp. CS2]|uniref:molybdenum cofactor biosynthesis protein MoaE n=1 Tax=Brevibacterium sp. CS2 TaxID=2575923 RepID=UPI0010C7AB32|nr:molybdenum cofactor biosynthesis protein MoaE [Brevibacterium sp. CS2]QCP04377.1 molybdenum cofactor biosynthesis protein MoaE [Brevibacterium sp. CS2]
MTGRPGSPDEQTHPSRSGARQCENTPAPYVAARITTDPLDPRAAQAAVTTVETGAAVVFSGVIRNHDEGRTDVVALDYTAHPDAAAIIAEVVARVAAEHPGVRVDAAHRIGPLRVGEDALVVAVASAHRTEAFACCAALVDAIKAEVPIWKRQDYAGGDHSWVGLA